MSIVFILILSLFIYLCFKRREKFLLSFILFC